MGEIGSGIAIDENQREEFSGTLDDWGIAKKLNPCVRGTCKHVAAAIAAINEFDRFGGPDHYRGGHYSSAAGYMEHFLKRKKVPDYCISWKRAILHSIRSSFENDGRDISSERIWEMYEDWEASGRSIPRDYNEPPQTETFKDKLRQIFRRKH